MPLDPKLVIEIFKSLQVNFILQELILTDDSLIYCNPKVFNNLFSALKVNSSSALCLIDLSRNIHSLDDNLKIHKDFVQALKKQKSENDEAVVSVNNDNYLEQLRLSSRSEDVMLLYAKTFSKVSSRSL